MLLDSRIWVAGFVSQIVCAFLNQVHMLHTQVKPFVENCFGLCNMSFAALSHVPEGAVDLLWAIFPPQITALTASCQLFSQHTTQVSLVQGGTYDDALLSWLIKMPFIAVTNNVSLLLMPCFVVMILVVAHSCLCVNNFIIVPTIRCLHTCPHYSITTYPIHYSSKGC